MESTLRWRDLPWLLATAAFYAALAKAVLTLYSSNGLVTVFWPGAGLALAAVLLGGRKYSISIFIGALAGSLWANEPAQIAAPIAAGSTLEALLGAWLLDRHGGFDTSLRSARDFHRLIGLAGLVSPAVCAVVGVGTLRWYGQVPAEAFWHNLAVWWMGDALGVVLVAPVILVWRHPPHPSPAKLAESVAVVGVSLLVGQVVFLDWFHDLLGQINRGYWMFLVVTWAAIRLGAHGLLVVLLVTTFQALLGATEGVGFFDNDLARTELLNFWAYMMILTTVGMSVATIFAERREAHKILRQSEEQLRLFIEHAPVAIAMLDREMRYLAASERWLTDYRLDGQHIIGRSHYEVFPEIPERWKAIHRRCLAGEVVKADEDPFARGDGSVQWLRWELRPWLRSDDVIGGIVMFTEDITERKRVTEALAAEEARYRAVIETAADGFWMSDERGRILMVNEAYARRSGYSSAELLAMSIADLDAHESYDEVRQHIDKVRSHGTDLFETWHRAKSGERWPVEVHASYSAEAGGRFFAFLRDLTERKRTAAALRGLREEMDLLTRFQVASQTAAAIAHELNQPLNALSAYAEAALRLLRAGNPQPDKLRHALESAAHQAQRAGRVVRELLQFMNQGEVQAEPVDLNNLVHKVLVRVKADGPNHVKFQRHLDHSLPPVSANGLQVEKVLVNLIENGIEAMRDAGVALGAITVRVRTDQDSGMAQVTVTDSGPGIDEPALARIFDPFFSTKPKGLGMGLAISRAIIEAHGGQLWVDSAPSQGASFHFTLPFAE